MSRLTAALALVCAIVALAGSIADAKPRQARADSAVTVYCPADHSYRQTCGAAGRPSSTLRNRTASVSGQGVIGHRPAGCPRRFCGCEASIYLFGRIDPYLNLAANWLRKFPRTSPRSGMAAARPGHVFVLVSHVEGNDWLVHDGNSGGGMTRQHVRSIRGYTVVDPNGNRMASR
jgi:hypothetical protein